VRTYDELSSGGCQIGAGRLMIGLVPPTDRRRRSMPARRRPDQRRAHRRTLSRAERLDPVVQAYGLRFGDYGRAMAEQADAKLAAGVDRGSLYGIPIRVRHLWRCVKRRTSAQSTVLDHQWGKGSQ
jgi:Asp-tRNA(Asn)/Glu-tRNA(Gln) amidotransferase A subunit family amidase